MTASTVVALAGRRIDPTGAVDSRFPLSLVPTVHALITDLFVELGPGALVCSAACGADLIALEIAEKMGVPFFIVLPFGRSKFRETSVVDRPGPWAAKYDRLVTEASRQHRLTELVGAGEGDGAYSAATRAIIDEAKLLASGAEICAVAVTDNNPRTSHDATAELISIATQNNFSRRIVTIPAGN